MTDKKDEALSVYDTLKLALEALEGAEALLLSMGLTHLIVYGDAEKAITAIRAALASKSEALVHAPTEREQPAPVAKPHEQQDYWQEEARRYAQNADFWRGKYESATAQRQEPVATLWQHGETERTRITMPGDITDCDARWFKVSDLYTTPQPAYVATPRVPERKPWVGLTDEEVEDLYFDGFSMSELKQFARAIEAKLMEKNNG